MKWKSLHPYHFFYSVIDAFDQFAFFMTSGRPDTVSNTPRATRARLLFINQSCVDTNCNPLAFVLAKNKVSGSSEVFFCLATLHSSGSCFSYKRAECPSYIFVGSVAVGCVLTATRIHPMGTTIPSLKNILLMFYMIPFS